MSYFKTQSICGTVHYPPPRLIIDSAITKNTPPEELDDLMDESFAHAAYTRLAKARSICCN